MFKITGENDPSTFVFRPGDQTPGTNVYTDWNSLVTALNQPNVPQGTKSVVVDASLGACTVPAGSYSINDATNIVWSGPLAKLPTGGTLLTISDGATLTPGSFCNVTNSLHIQSVSTSPVMTLSGSGERLFFFLSNGGQLHSAGTAPFISVQDATAVVFFELQFGSISNLGSAVVDMAVDGPVTTILVGDSSTISDNAISGGANTFLRYIYVSPSYVLASRNQSAFTGTLNVTTNLNRQANMIHNPNLIGGDYTVGPTDSLLSIDVSLNSVTVTLPDATQYGGRELIFITVAVTSPFTSTLQTVLGQTINSQLGSTTTFDLTGVNVFIRVISDFNNWLVVGQ